MHALQSTHPTEAAFATATGMAAVFVALGALLGAGAVRETIPELVEAERARHPDVAIDVTEHLGLHDGIVDAVLTRIDDSHGRRRDDGSTT